MYTFVYITQQIHKVRLVTKGDVEYIFELFGDCTYWKTLLVSSPFLAKQNGCSTYFRSYTFICLIAGES